MSAGTALGAADEIERLERLLGEDAGGPIFPALAEAHRRAGAPAQAERVARAGLRLEPANVAGRVALAMALFDQEREAEARRELERCLDRVPDHPLAGMRAATAREAAHPFGRPPGPVPAELHVASGLADGEIERAFESVRSETPRVDANALAALALEEDDDPLEDALRGASEAPFATETVARLLEALGDPKQAERIRRGLDARRPGPARDDRGRVVATFERWLDNLRRGVS